MEDLECWEEPPEPVPGAFDAMAALLMGWSTAPTLDKWGDGTAPSLPSWSGPSRAITGDPARLRAVRGESDLRERLRELIAA